MKNNELSGRKRNMAKAIISMCLLILKLRVRRRRRKISLKLKKERRRLKFRRIRRVGQRQILSRNRRRIYQRMKNLKTLKRKMIFMIIQIKIKIIYLANICQLDRRSTKTWFSIRNRSTLSKRNF